MSEDRRSVHARWAEFRFGVVGQLLASPPERGELQAALGELSERTWRHPVTSAPVRLGRSTIERWYYRARGARRDPVGALRAKLRKDAGKTKSFSLPLQQALRAQHAEHPKWSYQLHAENLVALAEEDRSLGSVPSPSTVRRTMKTQGLFRKKRRPPRGTAGAVCAARRLDEREVRSYEAEYVHGLWHFDFHQGSRKVITPRGEWVVPRLLAILDDHSRIICHAQWYLDEQTETLVHGLGQAFQKRGLPRAVHSDNGSAMVSGEVAAGLSDLGVLHETTLPHSPYQNGKQEVFFAPVEGRLLAMLEGVAELHLDFLNEATQAWLEGEYHRKVHSEIGTTPLRRFLDDPSVGRDGPTSEELRRAFRIHATRSQRRSDGTISVEGVRFEVPGRYRHIERLSIRYARWDLRSVDLVDDRTGKVLATLFPLDKTKNADGLRRSLEPIGLEAEIYGPKLAGGVAPLLKKLLAEYAATGLPPAYIPKDDRTEQEDR